MRRFLEYLPVMLLIFSGLFFLFMIFFALYARAECQSLGWPNAYTYPNGTIYCTNLEGAINIKELRK